MKKGVLIGVVLILSIFGLFGDVFAAPITDDLHLNLQVVNSSGDIQTSETFEFAFNISDASDCSNIVYSNVSTLTTDGRGIISHYLPDVTLDYDQQYWLCYYRDNSLISTTKLARVPYSFRATDVNLSEVQVDSNLNLTDIYNVTNVNYGFFDYLGSLADRVTKLFVTDIDVFNDVDVGGDINVSGAGYFDGKIQIGDDAILAQAGMLRFASNQFYGYNGTEWLAISAGAGSATPWTSGVGKIYYTEGNVGIGTTNPQNKLNVIGDGNFTTGLYVNNKNLENAYDYATNGTYYLASNPFGFYNSTTLSAAETDPHWTANYTLYNSTWSSTFNSTYNTWAYNQTTPAINKILSFDYYNLTDFDINDYYLNSNPFGYYNLTTIGGIVNTSYYVPYVGATANVVLGDNNLSVGGTDFFVNNNEGRVGIGTDSPSSLLDVSGSSGLRINHASPGNAFDRDVVLTSSIPSIIFNETDAGLDEKVWLLSSVNGDFQIAPRYDADTGGGVSSFYINRSGINTISSSFPVGNVGIGTTNPQNKLNVIGDGNFTGNLYGNAIYQNGEIVLDFSDNTTIYGYIDSQDLFYNTSIANWVIANYYLGSNPFLFYNSTTLQNVSQLVNDFVYLNDTTLTMSLIQSKGFYNTTDIDIQNQTMTNFVINTNTSMANYVNAQDILFNNSIAAYVNSQDVYYNTSLANYVNAQDILYNNSMKSYVDALNVSQGNWVIDNYVPYTGATKNVNLGANNFTVDINVLHVDSTGNRVGIGTSSPEAKLQISGFTGAGFATQPDLSLDVNEWFNFEHVGGFGAINWFTRGNGSTSINTHSSQRSAQIRSIDGNIYFYNSPTNLGLGSDSQLVNRMVVHRTGNVGIGTINPQNTLNVEGDVNVTETFYLGSAEVYTDSTGDMIFRI